MNSIRRKAAPAIALVCAVMLAVGGSVPAAWAASPAGAVKVYLMAGQSNMVGPGSNKYVEQNHPELMKPRNDVWCIDALTMGHVLGEAVDNPIVLFKTSTGGTTLHKHWRPPSAVKRAGGQVGPLYTRMIRRFHNMLANRDEAFPAFKGRPVERLMYRPPSEKTVIPKRSDIGFFAKQQLIALRNRVLKSTASAGRGILSDCTGAD